MKEVKIFLPILLQLMLLTYATYASMRHMKPTCWETVYFCSALIPYKALHLNINTVWACVAIKPAILWMRPASNV